MCGLAGIVARNKFAESNSRETMLNLMLDKINYRGPDQRGIWSGDRVSLGHLRLSILDLDGGVQPMLFDPSIVLIFNGEIYNAPELRIELIAAGQIFESDHSDTEVIYRGYSCFGLNFFHKLEGMFAIALYDQRVDSLYLVRDRSGIKPLYYLVSDKSICFASEPKCFEDFGLTTSLTSERLAEYFRFRVCLAPHTLFDGVYKVKPGEMLEINIKSNAISMLDNITGEMRWGLSGPNSKLGLDDVEQAIYLAVKRQVVADVKVGLYLSGGVDSSIIAAFAAKCGVTDAFTISTDSYLDESGYAKKVADQFGLKLHVLKISDVDFLNNLPLWAKINDDPIADPSALALMILSNHAASKGFKVMLAGDGADELFGGYNAHTRYLAAGVLRKILPKSFMGFIKNGRDPRLDDYISQDKLNYLGSAHSIDNILLKNLINYSRVDDCDSSINVEKNSKSAQSKHWLETDRLYRLGDDILPRTDRASMVASIEARVPFLDEYVLAKAFAMPNSSRFGYFYTKRKSVLKKLAIKLGVPKDCVHRRKLGFELPLGSWLKNDLSEFVKERIDRKNITEINYNLIRELYDALGSSSAHRLSTGVLWHWLTLELWYERWGVQ